LRVLLAALGALAACSDPQNPKCSGFVGDAQKPVELDLLLLGADAQVETAVDGGRAPLVLPSQGGRVVFVGLRARNLDTCAVQIIGSLRDPPSGRVVGLEGRPVNLTASGDGWALPTEPTQPSSFANVAVCPNHASSRDLMDQPYELTLSLTDHEGRTAEKTLTVTPFCAEPSNQAGCRCICREGYVLGDTCSADGGTT
jgi:hypothetical protein